MSVPSVIDISKNKHKTKKQTNHLWFVSVKTKNGDKMAKKSSKGKKKKANKKRKH